MHPVTHAATTQGHVADGGTVDLQREHAGDFLRLARVWQRRTHFSLMFAAFDNPTYRDGLIARLNAAQNGLCMALSGADTPHDWLARLQAAQQAGEKRIHVVWANPHPDTASWWQKANVLRESIADAFPATILIWLSDADIEAAAHQAPDLWNWREAVFTFTHAAPMRLPDLPSARFAPLSGPDALSVQQRLADIEHYLQQTDTDPLAAAHLQLEAAQAYQRLGQLTRSEATARAAASAFQRVGNAQLVAHAHSQIADVLQARGQLAEALVIWRTTCLPTFERLGLAVEKNIAQQRVAELALAVKGPS